MGKVPEVCRFRAQFLEGFGGFLCVQVVEGSGGWCRLEASAGLGAGWSRRSCPVSQKNR